MCEYCQNKSGLTDQRGCCISCGAPMKRQERQYNLVGGASGGYVSGSIEHIAKWTGEAWYNVAALSVGENGDLYIGGEFTSEYNKAFT